MSFPYKRTVFPANNLGKCLYTNWITTSVEWLHSYKYQWPQTKV